MRMVARTAYGDTGEIEMPRQGVPPATVAVDGGRERRGRSFLVSLQVAPRRPARLPDVAAGVPFGRPGVAVAQRVQDRRVFVERAGQPPAA